jgi:polysaccharide biosynthesis protein PelC
MPLPGTNLPHTRRRHLTALLAGCLAALVGSAGCMVREVQKGPALDMRSRWVLLPLRNQTETPQAGEKAEAILATLLRARGLQDIAGYTPPGEAAGVLPELDERRRAEGALKWAKERGFLYGVTGSVEEWRYRNGLDGEPAVGLSVQVVDLPSQRVVWSASGARAGWGRDTLAGTAQELLKALLKEMALK